MKTVISHSAAETRSWGEKLAKYLHRSQIISLVGNLGAGKTEFVKGLGKGLGIKQTILSPSYVLLRSYPFKKNRRGWKLHHLDLYRVQKTAELENLGWEEILQGPRRVVVIEWPKKINKFLPKKHLGIRFNHEQKINQRKLQFSKNPF